MRKIKYRAFLETKSGGFVRTDDVINHWSMEQLTKLLTGPAKNSLFTTVGKLACQHEPKPLPASVLPVLGRLSLELARKDWPSVIQH